jgi:flagellar motor switch protein FliN
LSERAGQVVLMGESQEEIDALLANVSQLAAETAADIVGSPPAPGGRVPASPPPAPVAEPPAGTPVRKWTQTPSSHPAVAPGTSRRTEDPQRILRLEVPVIVTLAERTMPFSKILTLSPGSIIEFDKPSDGLLDLMINNRCVGRGQAVKVGENFGLRVNIVGSVRNRMDAVVPS